MQTSHHNRFVFEITVTATHLDSLGHVNNVVYVQWMQDAAVRHWNSVSTTGAADAVTWMVKRHEIDYMAQAFEGDVLMMETWTGNHTAATWDRHYTVTRKSDNRKIIAAKSVWILLDKTTQRPKRIDDSILGRFA